MNESLITQDIIGAWELQSFVVLKNEEYQPWGQPLAGLLIYTEQGYVSVAINRNLGTTEFHSQRDSLFYSGTFLVRESTVVHLVEVATVGGRVGKEWVRRAEIRGDELHLSGDSDDGEKFKLVWRRV